MKPQPSRTTRKKQPGSPQLQLDTLVQDFIQQAMRAPMLSWDEEKQLSNAWRHQQCQNSLSKLIASYSRYVVKIAAGFRSYGLPMADLIQEGHIGILEAANRFDPEKGYRFSTYASWWIQSTIQDYVIRNNSIVRITTSSSQKRLYFNLRKLKAKLRRQDSPSDRLTHAELETISQALGVTIDSVQRMENYLSAPDQSLNATLSDHDSSEEIQNLLIDDAPSPEEMALERVDHEHYQRLMHQALQHLNERERRVLNERFLMSESKTLSEIGKSWGLTKERIRQIESQALEKLRHVLATIIPNHKEVF